MPDKLTDILMGHYRLPKKWKIIITICLICISLCIVYGFYLYTNRLEIIDPVIKAKPDDVISIIISPHRHIGVERDIVKSPVKVNDKKNIRRFCRALNAAKLSDANHLVSKWYCMLIVHKPDGTYYCDIFNSYRDGVNIAFNSHGEWGLPLGQYRSDSLGPIIESIVMRQGR